MYELGKVAIGLVDDKVVVLSHECCKVKKKVPKVLQVLQVP